MGSIYELTILILFRGDSIRRVYNLIAIVAYLLQFPNLQIYVREADAINHKLIFKLLPPNVRYEFVIDQDSILHKTRHFNNMLMNVSTPI